MTTRQCNNCKLYYPDMIWSHKVSRCPFCGVSIQDSKVFEYLTAEEKQVYRELNEEREGKVVEDITFCEVCGLGYPDRYESCPACGTWKDD